MSETTIEDSRYADSRSKDDSYSCLSISREDFLEIYAGTTVVDYVDLFYTKPESDVDLLFNYLPSKLWRLNNIYTIVNKDGESVRFCMNRSQHIVYADSLRHPRLIVLKSRQQGISTLWLVSFFDDALTRKNFSIGLMAQGQDEATVLLDRVKFLWDELSDNIKAFLGVSLKANNTKEFSLTNGSRLFVRTSFRSATLQRLHISEMGKIANKYPEKAKETKTGTLQALGKGNTGVIESTAEGDNMFKTMWDNAVANTNQELAMKDFKPVFLSWLNDPDCTEERNQQITDKVAKYFGDLEKELGYKLSRLQKNFWVVQYRELGDDVYREYPATPLEAFMATKQGAYWAELYMKWVVGHKRELPNLFDKNLDVELSVDLGRDDTFVVLPFQTHRKEFRIIDEFADNGQEIKYYCDWIKRRPWFSNLTRVILPHDAEVTELTSGKTRTEVFEEELEYDLEGNPTGIIVDVLERTPDVNTDIEHVRRMLHNLWIDISCEWIKMCFLNFKKEWDDKRERWRDKPEKNDAEHGASAIRYMVIGATGGTNYNSSNKSRPQARRNQGSITEQYGRVRNGDVEI